MHCLVLHDFELHINVQNLFLLKLILFLLYILLLKLIIAISLLPSIPADEYARNHSSIFVLTIAWVLPRSPLLSPPFTNSAVVHIPILNA